MDDPTKSTGNDDAGQADNSDDQMLPPVQVPDEPETQTVDANQTVPTDRSLVVTPEEAADSDLIEKEWVVKAKQIVEHTAEDPFAQQQELTKMKADYLKKRYDKDIGQPG